MIKVVLDTNISVSAFITGRGNEWTILDKVLKGELTSILSDELVKEFDEVISRPKFGYTRSQIESMKLLLVEVSHIVVPEIRLDAIKDDPQDNRVLECALAGGADYIISCDRHLLKLGEYSGIKIVRSREFLKILNSGN